MLQRDCNGVHLFVGHSENARDDHLIGFLSERLFVSARQTARRQHHALASKVICEHILHLTKNKYRV